MQKAFIFLSMMMVILVFTQNFLYHSFTTVEAATGTSPVGIMVALYFYPLSNSWDLLVDLKNQYPDVPIVAVINPDNGAGSIRDSYYATQVLKLQSAGITVIGYVYTNYAQRDSNQVSQEIDKYNIWYNVDGIFFDEVANFGQENYYRGVSQYAKSQGLSYIAGDPGTNVPASYIGIMDTYVIYENRGLPSLNFLANLYPNYDKRNFAITSYGVSNLLASDISSISNYVGYMSVTDDDLPNPYNTFPSYLELIFATLSSQNPSPSPINNPPVAVDKIVETNSNTPVSITLAGTDIDQADTINSFTIISSPSNGQISNFNSNIGTLTYTPNNNFVGQDSFTFKVTDSRGLISTNTGIVTINVKSTQPPDNEQPPLPLPSTVCTSSNVNLKGTQGNDDLIGTSQRDVIKGFGGNDRFNGCAGDDTLNGSSGNDGIAGGPGNDSLSGSLGNDILVGNEGRDRFSCGSGTDKILDFDFSLDVKSSDCEEF